MKRISTLALSLLLMAIQLAAVPGAGAADLGRIVGGVVGELAAGEAQRRYSVCIPYNLSMPGTYGGNVTVVGEGCPDAGGMSLTTTMTYAAYGLAPGVTVDGTANAAVRLVGDVTAGNITGVSVVMTGGPVTYMINGESYSVSYDDFTVEYANTMSPVSASGGLTINGVYYPATLELAGYII